MAAENEHDVSVMWDFLEKAADLDPPKRGASRGGISPKSGDRKTRSTQCGGTAATKTMSHAETRRRRVEIRESTVWLRHSIFAIRMPDSANVRFAFCVFAALREALMAE